MFDNFFSFTPTITESGSYYVIGGITCKYFGDDLKNVYGTSVIASRVIHQLSANRMRIHKFFMLELATILDDFINNQKQTKQRSFRVSLSKYRMLYDLVKEQTWIKSTLTDYEPYPLKNVLSDFRFTPYPDQLSFLEQYRTIKYGFQLKGCLLDAAPGSGKALWNESHVLTPTGYVKMRKIAVGDKVIGANGKPTTVLEVHPQGKKQLYDVTFADGRTVRCCEDHLWTITYNGQTKTQDTRTLINLLHDKSVPRITVPLMEGEYDGYMTPSEDDLDPYVFGLLLCASRQGADHIKISLDNRHLIKPIKEELYRFGYRVKKRDVKHYNLQSTEGSSMSVDEFITQQGLFYSGPSKKHIPRKYFNAGYTTRLAIIQALMDVGGAITGDSNIIFETTSKALAGQGQTLIRSIGGIAELSHRIPTYIIGGKKKKGKLIYRLAIEINNPQRLFRMSDEQHKLHRVAPVDGLKVVSIVPSITGYATCIKVDAEDHLFVTDHYTVTHNTYTSLVWSRMVNKGKTILLVPKHAIQDPWIEHLDVNGKRYCFKTPPKYWVSTSKTDPRKSDAEFFIFYKEQMRKDNWEGISFNDLLINLSNHGKIPINMIIDESHNYNEITAQQTQGMVAFASNRLIQDVLSMSGTPIKSAGKETYPLFCVIDPLFDQQVRGPFLKLYSRNNYFLNEMLAHRLGRVKFTINTIRGMEDPPQPVPIKVSFPDADRFTLDNIRAEMLAYIQERIVFYNKSMPTYLYDFEGYLKSYKALISDNEVALAELTRYRQIVTHFRKNGFDTLTDGENSRYCKTVEKKIEEILQLRGEELKYFRFILPAIKYLGLKVKGEALGNVLGRARIDAINECIKHVDIVKLVKTGVKKTAFYSTYIEAINLATEILQKGGCKPVKVHSQDKGDVKGALDKINSSQADSIVTSYETMGDAVNLTVCNQMLLLNLPWREYQQRQVIARVYRNGQDTECFVWVLELDTNGKENINTRTRDIMTYFAEQVDIILGNTNSTVAGATLKGEDDTEYNFNTLTPFDVSPPSFRPRFKDFSFTNIFR